MGLSELLSRFKEAEPTMERFVDGLQLGEEDQAEFARQMLGNPIFKFIHASMKSRLLEMWESTRAEESEVREDIHRTVRLLDSLKAHFEACLTWGISKKRQAEHLKTII